MDSHDKLTALAVVGILAISYMVAVNNKQESMRAENQNQVRNLMRQCSMNEGGTPVIDAIWGEPRGELGTRIPIGWNVTCNK